MRSTNVPRWWLPLLAVASAACGSHWKIRSPDECTAMCRGWDMELVGMVGVGDQGSSGEGATACVCQVRRASAPVAAAALEHGAAPAAALAAGPAQGGKIDWTPAFRPLGP